MTAPADFRADVEIVEVLGRPDEDEREAIRLAIKRIVEAERRARWTSPWRGQAETDSRNRDAGGRGEIYNENERVGAAPAPRSPTRRA